MWGRDNYREEAREAREALRTLTEAATTRALADARELRESVGRALTEAGMAMEKIANHEALCAQRQGQIIKSLGGLWKIVVSVGGTIISFETFLLINQIFHLADKVPIGK